MNEISKSIEKINLYAWITILGAFLIACATEFTEIWSTILVYGIIGYANHATFHSHPKIRKAISVLMFLLFAAYFGSAIGEYFNLDFSPLGAIETTYYWSIGPLM